MKRNPASDEMDSFRITKLSSRTNPKRNARSGHSRSRPAQNTQTVKEYFEKGGDSRFEHHSYLGGGGQGIVFRIAYKDPDSQDNQPQMLVMKYGRDTKRFKSESEALKVCLYNII